MKSYCNIIKFGNFIHHYYIENGVRKHDKVKFQPILGVQAPQYREEGWHDIYGGSVNLRKFESIKEAQVWKKDNENMITIYGDIAPVYQFTSFEYPDEPLPQKKSMRIYNFDIEVYSDEGFPEPDAAKWPITAITLQNMVTNTYHVFAYKEEYTPKRDNVHYYKFRNEEHMLEGFLAFWQRFTPDIITGWNIETFDVPYIVNRAEQILEPGSSKRLSPVGFLRNKTVKGKFGSNDRNTYDIYGVSMLDYMMLYMKFGRTVQERYSLDHIGKVELGEGKVDYHAEFNNLADLYNEDFETYIDYNIRDVEVVYMLDQKFTFIDLIIMVSYMTHCQFQDCFGTVKPWDSFLYNTLLHEKIAVPPVRSHIKSTFEGGYVKEPVKGLRRGIDMYDIASSYPNNDRVWNISPETIINYGDLPEDLKLIRDKFGNVEACLDVDKLEEITPYLEKYNVTFCASGEFYKRDKQGFIPRVMGEKFDQRLVLKRKAQDLDDEVKMLERQIRELEAV